MLYSNPHDVAVGPIIAVMVCAGLGVFIIVTLMEAGVLRLLKWGTFKKCLGVSLVMNLATTVLGFVLYSIPGSSNFISPFPYGSPWNLVTTGLLSALGEWIVLMFFKRGALRENAIAALIANATSYLIVMSWLRNLL